MAGNVNKYDCKKKRRSFEVVPSVGNIPIICPKTWQISSSFLDLDRDRTIKEYKDKQEEYMKEDRDTRRGLKSFNDILKLLVL